MDFNNRLLIVNREIEGKYFNSIKCLDILFPLFQDTDIHYLLIKNVFIKYYKNKFIDFKRFLKISITCLYLYLVVFFKNRKIFFSIFNDHIYPHILRHTIYGNLGPYIET